MILSNDPGRVSIMYIIAQDYNGNNIFTKKPTHKFYYHAARINKNQRILYYITTNISSSAWCLPGHKSEKGSFCVIRVNKDLNNDTVFSTNDACTNYSFGRQRYYLYLLLQVHPVDLIQQSPLYQGWCSLF